LIATYLENTSLAAAIRDSLWAYPALEIIHIIGITMLVGAAFLFDLRLLGSSKELPLMSLSRHLLPWSKRGLLFIVPSGFLLFITNAVALANNPVFWLKMALLLSACFNGWLFHRKTDRMQDNWQEKHRTPRVLRIIALVSMLLWTAVIACGRLLAYY
jgi:hypothetical protein